MVFVVVTVVFCAFLLVLSILLIQMGIKTPQTSRFGFKSILLIFGFTYLLFAQWSAYAALGLSLSETYTAPCENLLNQTFTHVNVTHQGTTEHTDQVVDYHYIDSCATRTTPEVVTNIFVVFSYLMIAELIGIGFYMFYIVFKFLRDSIKG